MVIEQEFADLYPLTEEILLEYLPGIDCRDCGVSSCVEFAEALTEGRAESSQCPEMDPRIASMMAAALKFELPRIPYNCMMENFPPSLIKINDPEPGCPVLVTGNFQETVRLLQNILTSCSVSAFLLMSDTKGYSVDNAVEEKRFSAFEILKVLSESGVGSLVTHRNLIIPGLAKHLANQIKQATGWQVVVGPVSGLEIPMFLASEEMGY